MPRPASRWPLRLSFVLALAAPPAPWTPARTFLGAAPDDHLGHAVAWAGDVDADGCADLIAGAPGDDTGGADAGSATVFSGRDGSVLHVFVGQAPGDVLGSAVAAAGDVDGDGHGDLIVGAPGDDTGGTDAGRATVFSGRDGSVLHTYAGAAAGDALGAAVAAAGDVDGDGYDDVIVGAPGDDTSAADAGSATVFSGRDGSVLYALLGEAAGDAFGAAVAGAGDVDGDGRSDVLVGAPLDDDGGVDAGSVFVFAGSHGALLRRFDGESDGDQLGAAVAGGGDTDLDGRPDPIVGAPHAGADAGLVRVFSGAAGTELRRFVGAAAGELLGYAVAAAGDFDGDGRADVVAGAPGRAGIGADAGAALVWSGASGARLAVVDGAAAGDGFGWSVAGGADVDGDGFSDLAVGAPRADGGAPDSGSACVFARTPFDRLAPAVEQRPALAAAQLGVEVQRLGDVDGDGVPDYGAGAPFHATLGAVWVFSGADHSVLRTFLGPVPDIFFGTEVGDAGDVDQDGYADIIVGAFHEDLVAQDCGSSRVFSGRTGALIREFFGPSFRSHMGSAGGTLGDIDGDLVDDLFIGMGLHANETGALRVYSGRTSALLWQVDGLRRGDWFGWSAAAVDDIDGDGRRDLIIGAPAPLSETRGYALLVSGADGTPIRTFNGDGPTDRFGWDVDAAGDVNADGVADVIVGADQYAGGGMVDAGLVRVFSGADGALLHEKVGQAAGQLLGRGVSGAGDVNGDGFDDFVVGAPGVAEASGAAYVYSGQDGALLYQIRGAVIGDMLGGDVAMLADIGGDGYADVLVGVPEDDTAGASAGSVQVHETEVRADPGAARALGAACPGSNGQLPRIGFGGATAVGAALDVTLRAALPATGTALLIGASPQTIPIDFLGAPACTLVTLPLFTLGAATDPGGRADVTINVPAHPALVGGHLYVQWLVVDLLANPLGGVLSDGGDVRLGI